MCPRAVNRINRESCSRSSSTKPPLPENRRLENGFAISRLDDGELIQNKTHKNKFSFQKIVGKLQALMDKEPEIEEILSNWEEEILSVQISGWFLKI